MPTLKLLDEMAHATYTKKCHHQSIQTRSHKHKVGEEPGPGQFAPVINTIIDDGRQLLQEQLL